MNINFNPSFTSRNQNIRKTDDVQRRARLTFPATSPTFIDTFYKTPNSSDEQREEQATLVLYKYDTKIGEIRQKVRNHSFEGTTPEEKKINAPIFGILKGVKETKAANCQECAAVAVACLAANGIYDIQRVKLELELKYVNKKNGTIEYQANIPIDHTAVKTRIGKDTIIVDAWMGFADSLSGAREKYKKAFINEDIKNEIQKHSSNFKMQKSRQNHIIDFDESYELRTSIRYISTEFPTQKNIEEIGHYAKCFYPELVL